MSSGKRTSENVLASSDDDDLADDDTNDSDLKKAEQNGGLARQIHRALVQNAIKEMENGNTVPLDELTSQLTVPFLSLEGLSVSQLYQILFALKSHIDQLSSNNCVSLIRTVINLPGMDTDPQTLPSIQQKSFMTLTRLHSQFLGVLISSMPKWYSEVVGRIVSSFSTACNWSAERWHLLLPYIVELVPTATSVLQSAIVRLFPYKYEALPLLMRYVANILRVADYVPDLRGAIWGVVIERVVEVDVDIENKLDELDELDELDDDDTEGLNIWDKAATAATTVTEPEYGEDEQVFMGQLASSQISGPTELKVMSVKLDSIVSYLLSQLEPMFKASNITNEALSLFSTLLSHFTKYVLPTHRTHAIQYLFFSVSQSAPEFTDAYLALLLETALAPAEPIPRRQMAMQYLASYVARARSVTESHLRSVITILGGWISRYIDEREQEVPSGESTPVRNGARAAAGFARFSMFYSVVQGYFYIFCFRHTALRIDGDDDRSWARDVPQLLQRVVNTRFNPLKWCNADVVSMFAKVAQREGAAYCFSVMRKNKYSTRLSSPTEKSTRPITALRVDIDGMFSRVEMKPLEGYFPFDPLLLKQLRQHVSPDYVSWVEASGGQTFSSDEEDISDTSGDGSASDSDEESDEEDDGDDKDDEE
ncbi:RNA polymerase I-specific transcription initiation factor RRN3 [Lipomyces arxii]|uniref:RNA polymerase I-specific transcription initiation factor RRN3 n=1 Tax=Lipomyces arxii TaxID=56418 RepID=UPI0034CEB561